MEVHFPAELLGGCAGSSCERSSEVLTFWRVWELLEEREDLREGRDTFLYSFHTTTPRKRPWKRELLRESSAELFKRAEGDASHARFSWLHDQLASIGAELGKVLLHLHLVCSLRNVVHEHTQLWKTFPCRILVLLLHFSIWMFCSLLLAFILFFGSLLVFFFFLWSIKVFLFLSLIWKYQSFFGRLFHEQKNEKVSLIFFQEKHSREYQNWNFAMQAFEIGWNLILK